VVYPSIKCLFYSRKHVDSIQEKFYRNNLFDRASNAEVYCFGSNLKGKKTIADVFSKKRYFIATAIDFKEYNLFGNILNVLICLLEKT
jgi:hypothetical protein